MLTADMYSNYQATLTKSNRYDIFYENWIFFPTIDKYFDLCDKQMPDDKLGLFVHSECFILKVNKSKSLTVLEHPTSHF